VEAHVTIPGLLRRYVQAAGQKPVVHKAKPFKAKKNKPAKASKVKAHKAPKRKQISVR